MTNNGQIVDMIERANDAHPMCACGRYTTPVWRDGVVWLECSSVTEAHEGRIRRAWAALTAHIHTHERIVEVPSFTGDQVPAT